jgi:hypothetical protein
MTTLHPNAEKLIARAEEFFAEVADLCVASFPCFFPPH